MTRLKEIECEKWNKIVVKSDWEEISSFIKNNGKLFTCSNIEFTKSNGWEFYSIKFQQSMLSNFKKLVDNEERIQVMAKDKQNGSCVYEIVKVKKLSLNDHYYRNEKDNLLLVNYGRICEKVINKMNNECIFDFWDSENSQECYKDCCLVNLLKYNSKILTRNQQFASEESFYFLQEVAGEIKVNEMK